MLARAYKVALIGLFIATSAPGCSRQAEAQVFGLERAFPRLRFTQPTSLVHAPDGSNRLFVLERAGRVRVFRNTPDVGEAETFLDLRHQVQSRGLEEGLLGIAFHPDFARNGYFFLNFTVGNPRRTVIARYRASEGKPNRADTGSEAIILTFEQPFSNHNGGQLAFGPDGYLYIGTGDGGGAGDPRRNAQDLTTLLGSWLRIDVNRTSGDRNYAIPPDNPFAGNTQGYREEIYTYGLRNLWRFSYDPETDRWWGGDVGQNHYEEVNLLEKGQNYGWPLMEGNACYPIGTSCDKTGLTMPVVAYSHREGSRTVIGGYVYRGKRVPELVGSYLYADFLSGQLWRLDYDGGRVTRNQQIARVPFQLSSFGLDADREVYMLGFDDGHVYRFE